MFKYIKFHNEIIIDIKKAIECQHSSYFFIFKLKISYYFIDIYNLNPLILIEVTLIYLDEKLTVLIFDKYNMTNIQSKSLMPFC